MSTRTPKLKVKVGDTVKVIAGKDRAKTGKVTQVLPALQKVVVDGVNQMVKHLKSSKAGEKGQRIEFFGPIHVSNVMVMDPEKNVPTRVGVSVVTGDDGSVQKFRTSKKSNATF